MRTAIISDIHGNLAGLMAAFADIEGCSCSRILCLGDLVDGGPSDLAVVREIMNRRIRSVRGNHDEVARIPRGSPEDHFLRGLPETIVEEDVVFVHVSPLGGVRGVTDRDEAWNVFDDTTYRIAFIGHAHVPRVFRHRGLLAGAAEVEAFAYGRPLGLDAGDRYIISVGAVGYGRDGVKAVRYGVYDSDAGTIEIRRVEAPVLDL